MSCASFKLISLSSASINDTTIFPSTRLTLSTLSRSNRFLSSSVKSFDDKPLPCSTVTLLFNASCVAVDIGFSKSEVLSTLSRPTYALSISSCTSISVPSLFLKVIFLLLLSKTTSSSFVLLPSGN